MTSPLDRPRAQTPASKLRIIGLAGLLVLALALQACSTLTLGYNRAATLTYWWLDGQLNLNETQSLRVRNELGELHRWHRREALPQYADLLRSWEQLASRNITAEQACQQFETVRAQLMPLAERSVGALVQLGQSISPEQIEHLRREQAEDNQRFREDFVDAPRSGLDKRVKRLIDRLEMFYGRLDPAQRQLVSEQLARGSFDGRVALAERERRQSDVVQTIAAIQANPAHGAALVKAAVQRAVESPSPLYRTAAQRWQREGCELLAALHNTSNATQRQNLAESLRTYTGNFTLLAQED